ncbi:MAG: hypothetical protein ACJ72D_13610 [Marmoricola sp.]
MGYSAMHLLTGAFAVDALSPQDGRSMARHLVLCADCRNEVAGLRRAATGLAEVAATPAPPGLRGQVLDAVRAQPSVRSAKAARTLASMAGASSRRRRKA